MKQIRTYMPYSYPVDPVRLVSIADMDLSYALASTMVQWDKDKQVSGAVAESWETPTPTTYRFKIRRNLKWSDNTPVTAADVKKSFERAFKVHPEDLRSLINLTKKISVSGNDIVEFELTTETKTSGFLGKLTEPNYGILKIKQDGSINLAVTTGAFFLNQDSPETLILRKNVNWFLASDDMANEIVIRKPLANLDWQGVLLSDEWPNFIETSSMISADAMEAYRSKNYPLWTRPLDKLFMIQLSKTFANSEGPALLRFLNKALDRSELTKGISGVTLTNQVFPDGYQLHDNEISSLPPSNQELPKALKTRPLNVIISGSRVGTTLRSNLERVLKNAGVNPKFEIVSLDKMSDREKKAISMFTSVPWVLQTPIPKALCRIILKE